MWLRLGLIAILLASAGCSDFSQHRLGGVRLIADVVDNKPSLTIPNPVQEKRDDNVKQAAFAAEPVSMRVLYDRAAQRHAAMDSYIFRMKRREVVSGVKQPEEVMAVKVRREPFSVHLKWLGNTNKGREVVYVQGKFDNKMQVLTADGDLPFIPGGSRWAFALDSPLVQGKSRYPITSTGLGSLIERYGKMVAAIEKGESREGAAKYVGKVKRPEFAAEVEAVHQKLPPSADTGLPKGGERWWYFDVTSGLPVLIVANDPNGEVEYYCHDHIQWPVRLDDDDFNPDRLWKK